MEKSEPPLTDQTQTKTLTDRCAEFVAFLLLSLVAVIGSFAVNEWFPMSDSLTVILFGTGILSSMILIKIE